MVEAIKVKARNLFIRYGLKSISMDDLARHCGVSKKTIYQSYSDKNELVNAVVNDLLLIYETKVSDCAREAANAVEEVVRQSNGSFKSLSIINLNFFYELEKFFPAAWEKIRNHRNDFLMPRIRKNLERGLEEGLYRKDLDPGFITELRLQQISTALNPSLLNNKRAREALMCDLTKFYLHGITNENGSLLIDKYLNNDYVSE